MFDKIKRSRVSPLRFKEVKLEVKLDTPAPRKSEETMALRTTVGFAVLNTYLFSFAPELVNTQLTQPCAQAPATRM